MKKKQAVPSPVSTGSGGVTFEHKVQTEFIILMISKGITRINRFNTGFEIEKISFQTRYNNIKTDDMMLTFKPNNGSISRVFAQMKLTIRLGNNELFRSVLEGFWKDFNNTDFSKTNDVFALIMGVPTNKKTFDAYTEILGFSRSSLDFKEFKEKIIPFQKYTDIYDELFELLCDINNSIKVSEQEFFIFLKHIFILDYDYNIESTSRDYANIIGLLNNSKRRVAAAQDAESIWSKLYMMVCEENYRAGSIDSKAVFNKFPELKEWFIPQLIDTNPVIDALENQKKIMIFNLNSNKRLDHNTKKILLESIDEVYIHLKNIKIDKLKEFLNVYQHPRKDRKISLFSGIEELFEMLTYINCKIKNWSLINNELANFKINTEKGTKWIQLLYSTQKSTFPMVIMNLGLELYDRTPTNDYFKYRWIIENVNTDLEYENLCELCGIGNLFPFSKILSDFSYGDTSSYFEDVPNNHNSYKDLGNIKVCCTKCLRKVRELSEVDLESKLKEVLLLD